MFDKLYKQLQDIISFKPEQDRGLGGTVFTYIHNVFASTWSLAWRIWPVWLALYLWYWHGSSLARAYTKGKLNFCHSIHDINFRGRKYLVTDIENTLEPRGVYWLSDRSLATFRRARLEGIVGIILRTNRLMKQAGGSGDYSQMVEQLKQLGFDQVYLRQPRWLGGILAPLGVALKWPRKPWRFCFRSDRQLFGHPRRFLMLAVGDKVRFDVLRPVKLGWRAVVVDPIGPDGRGDKFVLIRPLENLTLSWFGLSRTYQPAVPPLRWASAVAAVAGLGVRYVWLQDPLWGVVSLTGVVIAVMAWLVVKGLNVSFSD